MICVPSIHRTLRAPWWPARKPAGTGISAPPPADPRFLYFGPISSALARAVPIDASSIRARMRVAFRMVHLLPEIAAAGRAQDSEVKAVRPEYARTIMTEIAQGQDGQLTAQHPGDNNPSRG